MRIFGCPCSFGFMPDVLLYLLIGASLGLIIGAMPGLGGLVGLALLLPFTFDMEAFAALALAMGMLSTLNTSDTLPAILFAVPGTNAAQATIMDGYPMAQRGEAGRALGASYSASAIGGVFGAIVLALSIPLLRPLVLLFAAPELFMMALLGISMVATLSGRSPMRGLVVAFLGLLLGMVGADPQLGYYRFTFGQVYLFDGISLVPLALGLFAIPEMIDLCIRGTSLAHKEAPSATRGVMTGIRDSFRHWFLIVRSSALGVWVGALPGLGGSVVDWIAYGHAAQTEKGASETFGKGDVRGVIAPESANNAREGGSLIPTIAFGIPGNAAMALLLAIFLTHGIAPGPSMLTTNLPITYSLVFGIAIANIFGTAVLMALGNWISRIAKLPGRPLAAFVLAVVFLAALSATRNIGDLIVLLVVGVLGWFMKRTNWARPPLILAFILSPIMEQYFFLSTQRHGAAWLTRPIVMIIAVLMVTSVGWGIYKTRRESRPDADRDRDQTGARTVSA